MRNPADRLIVALDFPNLDEALRTVDGLSDTIHYYKVGLELLSAEGAPRIVSELHRRNLKVFLDGKFNDIPNTIAGAARETSRLGVALFNLHASSGKEAMKAAAENKGNSQCIAVTVLTALGESDCRMLFQRSPAEAVRLFAEMAQEAGLDGVVCSPQELELLGDLTHFLKVTPGVRPAWAAAQDQKRFLSPFEAIKKGATHLVIGRPITQPPKEIGSPKAAAERILEEMDKAL